MAIFNCPCGVPIYDPKIKINLFGFRTRKELERDNVGVL